jgi:hypothetical protein
MVYLGSLSGQTCHLTEHLGQELDILKSSSMVELLINGFIGP